MDIKVAVTATSAAGSAVVLANYNRLCLDKRRSTDVKHITDDTDDRQWDITSNDLRDCMES